MLHWAIVGRGNYRCRNGPVASVIKLVQQITPLATYKATYTSHYSLSGSRFCCCTLQEHFFHQEPPTTAHLISIAVYRYGDTTWKPWHSLRGYCLIMIEVPHSYLHDGCSLRSSSLSSHGSLPWTMELMERFGLRATPFEPDQDNACAGTCFPSTFLPRCAWCIDNDSTNMSTDKITFLTNWWAIQFLANVIVANENKARYAIPYTALPRSGERVFQG